MHESQLSLPQPTSHLRPSKYSQIIRSSQLSTRNLWPLKVRVRATTNIRLSIIVIIWIIQFIAAVIICAIRAIAYGMTNTSMHKWLAVAKECLTGATIANNRLIFHNRVQHDDEGLRA